MSVIVWIVAALTIRGLRRGDVVARYGLLLVGAMVALVSGLERSVIALEVTTGDGGSLTRSPGPRSRPDSGSGSASWPARWPRCGDRRRVRTFVTSRDPRWLERLVGDLDDEALSVVCTRMVADEVIPIALAGFAERAAPVASAFGGDALVFVVLAEDGVGSHAWSITAGARGLRVQRGTPAPMRAELRTTFPAFLQLLAGTRTLEVLMAAGRLDVRGRRGARCRRRAVPPPRCRGRPAGR